MTEPITQALQRLARLTAELGYPNAVIGGAAIIVRSRVRVTRAVDLVMSWPPAELDRLLAIATRHGYIFDPANRPLAEEGLIRLVAPPGSPYGVGLDLILADSPYLEQVIARHLGDQRRPRSDARHEIHRQVREERGLEARLALYFGRDA